MRRSVMSRIEKIERQTSIDDFKITIIEKIVDKDENEKLFISYGYRIKIWTDEPDEYLPREYFKNEDPTPSSLINPNGSSV